MAHLTILQLQSYVTVGRLMLLASFADTYLYVNWYTNQFASQLHKHVPWYVLATMFWQKLLMPVSEERQNQYNNTRTESFVFFFVD